MTIFAWYLKTMNEGPFFYYTSITFAQSADFT